MSRPEHRVVVVGRTQEEEYMTALIEPIQEVVRPRGDNDHKRVLVCLGRYLPGSKDGGPIRSITNMVTHLSPYFDFYVVTADRDVKDTERYPGITPDRWHRVGSALVLYCSSVGPAVMRRAFREVRPDVVVLNSFLDKFTQIALLLRRGGAFGKTPTLLAPRGEFSAGAMEIKRRKKDLYRKLAKMLGFSKQLLWQVSTVREKQELLEAAPARRLDPNSVHVAYNITDGPVSTGLHVTKEAGSLKLVFISRISEKKNLHYLLETLRECRGQVHLNLFGPVTEKDEPYWEKCKTSLAQLPDNIKVDYHGSLDHLLVSQVLRDHHFFILPTRGENFCHAAVESFVNGTPVILSDETPWTDLEQARAGFDISLGDRGRWAATLQKCVDMDQQAYESYLEGAREYGRRFSVEEAVRQHLLMFHAALAVVPSASAVS
jgi:glycosyltransferase involved in cell wall biosynthesis